MTQLPTPPILPNGGNGTPQRSKPAIVISLGLLGLFLLSSMCGDGKDSPTVTFPSQNDSTDNDLEDLGNPAVYDRIEGTTDCAALQHEFDIAADNNERAKPGTDEHKRTLGYMRAANSQLQAAGCY